MGTFKADPVLERRPARCSVCGRSARNRSDMQLHIAFDMSLEDVLSTADPLRAQGASLSPFLRRASQRACHSAARHGALVSLSGATQAAGTIGLAPPPAFPAQPAESSSKACSRLSWFAPAAPSSKRKARKPALAVASEQSQGRDSGSSTCKTHTRCKTLSGCVRFAVSGRPRPPRAPFRHVRPPDPAPARAADNRNALRPNRTEGAIEVETAGPKGAKFAVRVRRCGRGRWPSCGRVERLRPTACGRQQPRASRSVWQTCIIRRAES